jgi:ethanolamine kinase
MALALNKSNFGAKVRAVFQNGWVEDFIESSSLVPLDMKKREILTTVAGIIKRFHELDMPHRIARPQAIAETATTSSPYGEGAAANVAGEFWETIEVWYSMALEVSFPEDPEKQKLLDALCVPQLKEKIKRVRKMCDATNSPTVFCHNDIHAGNFLVEEPSKKLILIDFEYSAHGPRGFDLANFFCEFAGFECDYSLLPDKTTREVFYEIYLSAGDTVEQLEKEVEVFYIATHFFWGIWSVLQSKFSPIEFDFLDYARMRLRQGAVLLGENADSMSPSKPDSPLETPKSPNAPSSWGTVNEAHFTKSPRHSLDKSNTR